MRKALSWSRISIGTVCDSTWGLMIADSAHCFYCMNQATSQRLQHDAADPNLNRSYSSAVLEACFSVQVRRRAPWQNLVMQSNPPPQLHLPQRKVVSG